MLQTSHSQRPLHPSLQAKMQLLDCLQKGNIERVRQLAYALSKVGRTNPELYGKLSMFVQEHKEELKQVDSDDDNEEPQIQNVDDDFVEGKQWDDDESVQYEDDDERDNEENEQGENFEKENMKMKQQPLYSTKKQPCTKKQPFKEVKNTPERRSVSSKKFTPAANNTYQFKSPALVSTKKTADLKPSASKPLLHRNSAIGKTKTSLQH